MVWAAAVLAAIYWATHAARDGARPLWAALVKAGAVAMLALAGAVQGAPWPVVLGLALGAAGDFALARAGQRWFLAGMAAFAAGHLAYAGWFLAVAGGPPPAALAVAALCGASTELWLAPHTGGLRAPVRGYVAVILLMAAAAAGLPPGHGRVQAGVALFVLSDLVLSLHLFVLPAGVPRRAAAWAVWPLYWGGQALILWGALSLPPPLA
jgi:uncharacterized membrane protein YhhN